MFCVECGREGLALAEGVCADCLVRTQTLATFPDRVAVEICAHCGSLRRGSAWEDYGGSRQATLQAQARQATEVDPRVEDAKVEVDVRAEDERHHRLSITVTGRVQQVPVRLDREIRGTIRPATCLRCSRVFGGYYEAIVQLRGEGKLRPDQVDRAGAIVSRVLDRMQAAGNRDAFLVEAREEKGGVDYYLGTTASARIVTKALTEEMGARLSESASLVGRKDGREMYRVTFLARVPEYAPGSFVGLDDRIHRVQTVGPKLVSLVDLATGRSVTEERERMRGARVFLREEIARAVVVSETETDLLVVDPATMRTVELRKPAGFARSSGEVPVLRWNDELYLAS
ncbi:MAG TPA: NMD3-related protein [Candidatus Thermoplasmatota archaeon]|nr:NMD3-related protein [Candidatus Thermoplasmatota archaeon]